MTKFCSNCGAAIESGARFCPECGNVISNESAQMYCQVPSQPQQGVYPSQNYVYAQPAKSKTTALLLCFFLGCWGVHKFYLKETNLAIVMLVIGFIGLFLLFLPLLITGIWSLIDLIIIISMSDAEFNAKYNNM